MNDCNFRKKKIYVHEIAATDLSKIYFLKNAKKTCKPNNRDLNRNWINSLNKKVIQEQQVSNNLQSVWSLFVIDWSTKK